MQQIAIGRGGGTPADRPQVRGQNLGAVRRAAADPRPGVLLEHPGADLGVPDDLDLLALGIVGDAGQAKRGQVVLGVIDGLDQPRPAANLDEIALLDLHRSAGVNVGTRA